MVERLNGIEKVRGSTPLISTIPKVRFAQWNQGLDAFSVLGDKAAAYASAIASISSFTSLGRRAACTQLRAGFVEPNISA